MKLTEERRKLRKWRTRKNKVHKAFRMDDARGGVRFGHDDSSESSSASDGIRPPSPTSPVKQTTEAAHDSDDDVHFAVVRSAFLYGTAASLSNARLEAAKKLKIIVDDLGHAVDQLRAVRSAIDRACELHAALESIALCDISCAEASSDKHLFGGYDAHEAVPLSVCIDKVVDMFMADFRGNGGEE
jgi:hypothetical protein